MSQEVLLQRLENIVSRLESLEHKIGSSSTQSSPSSTGSSGNISSIGSSASVLAYEKLIADFINPYIQISKKIDPEIGNKLI